MKIPVLTYHSTNISGNEYSDNDLVAFRADLKLINDLGVVIISAKQMVQWLEDEVVLDLTKKYVVLTFDDGCELDFIDWMHPTFGQQQSFYSTMKSYNNDIHATSFVIASSEARKVLVKTCTAGYEIWGDQWWQEAENTGLMSIENHSWDHVHHTLENVSQLDNIKGDFKQILSDKDANNQISNASEYIDSCVIKKQTSLFAYPYGHYNTYLVDNFFPKEQSQIKAAFTCEPNAVSKATNKWMIPRYVCGLHWKNTEELKQILVQGI